MRIEVTYRPRYGDGRASRLLASINRHLGPVATHLLLVDVYLVAGVELTGERARKVFSDPVAQECFLDGFMADGIDHWKTLVEITSRPGVTDTLALTAAQAIEMATGRRLPPEAIVQTSRQYLFSGSDLDSTTIERLARELHNPLIQRALVIDRTQWGEGVRPPAIYPHQITPSPPKVEIIDLSPLDNEGLADLSRTRLLALSIDEMKAIKSYIAKDGADRRRLGLGDGITDVELEMIAQTWSEHCKHKIFRAQITYREDGREETIDSLFKTYVRTATEKSGKSYLKSVFRDDAGVVAFDDETLLCFKVETHNSPSALDPYGGAITGIVGVNRDILGTGKGGRPIFNTNVLCFADPETKDVPEGLLPPRRVMEGVHHGIIDGGNQSGIPVVAGAFLFDESYLGKPLVFCGTGGILPAKVGGEEAWIGHVNAGDLVVMVGGRIGKDGIHGATFSSLALDKTSPTSAVQIGDPIIQKKMTDFLIEARDAELFCGITDNGAGGLSSSLGEMAMESGGVRIDLDRCPLKYTGLAPWEILLSESQERMSLAVPPENRDSLIELAGRRGVEATVIGEFTDTGYVEIRLEHTLVGRLACLFLDDGLPQMKLVAEWKKKEYPPVSPVDRDAKMDLLALLADNNICSREELVRQYDHEVQARSVVGPFAGVDRGAPSDGAVLRVRPGSNRGLTVTHGICPRYGDDDTYHMAMCAVDEALRAHVASGGDPDEASALDNFCWPDPIASDANPDGPYKLAQLVRACKGLHDACVAFGLPLISGKDSMKNDAFVGDRKISVRPTLLVSLMGVIPDVRQAVTTDFKRSGHTVYLLGATRGELGGTCYERLVGLSLGQCPRLRPEEALRMYRQVHRAMRQGLIASCHDLSDGGLAVALCESALGGGLGAAVDLGDFDDTTTALFCETPSRFLLTCAPSDAVRLETSWDWPLIRLGEVTEDRAVEVRKGGTSILKVSLDEIGSAWRTPI